MNPALALEAAAAEGWRWPRLSINALLLVVTLYVALGLNLSFWRQVSAALPSDFGWAEAGLLLSLFVALNALLLLVLLPLSLPRLVRPLLAAWVLVAAGCSYFMDSYGVVIDASMIANLLQTDAREAGELIGWPLLAHVAVWGLLPAVLILRTPLCVGSAVQEWRRRLGLAALVIVAALAAVTLDYKSVSLWARAHRDVRLCVNPTAPLYAVKRHLAGEWQRHAGPDRPPTPIATDAVRQPSTSGRPRVLVLVVGETARADHFSLLGYGRDTNPELRAQGGVVGFNQAWSCGTATAVSVPCMFSNLGRAAFSRARAAAQENLLDVLQRVGVSVLWRENNSDCKGVCLRVPTDDLRHGREPERCDEHGCRDETLLQGLPQRLAQGQGDQVIVLHMLGSHGPSYFRRYPAEYRRFEPACERDEVQTCTREAIVNAYDNSIAYTDHVLARVIDLLRAQQPRIEPTLIYVSDHGESLGENGLYLHGLPYALAPDAQKHVPLLVWSPERSQSCLQARRAQPTSHDQVFDTVLGLFSIQTRAYHRDNDLLRGC